MYMSRFHLELTGLINGPFEYLDVMRKVNALRGKLSSNRYNTHLYNQFHGEEGRMAKTIPQIWGDGEQGGLKRKNSIF